MSVEEKEHSIGPTSGLPLHTEAGTEARAGANSTYRGAPSENIVLDKDAENNDGSSSAVSEPVQDATAPEPDGATEENAEQGKPPPGGEKPGEKMSKAMIAVVMSALCVCISRVWRTSHQGIAMLTRKLDCRVSCCAGHCKF
jgi:hypothetical protein